MTSHHDIRLDEIRERQAAGAYVDFGARLYANADIDFLVWPIDQISIPGTRTGLRPIDTREGP